MAKRTERTEPVEGVWLLKHADGGGYVRAIDGEFDNCYMAFFSYRAAEREAKRQNEMYDFDCFPHHVAGATP